MTEASDLGIKIGLLIKRERIRLGLNQTELAKIIEITQGMLSHIENGERNLRMNTNTLCRFALALGYGKLHIFIKAAEDYKPEGD